ncbi:hypothetical protein Asi03nite_64020 [Actinoplanes siamensis]|uniref:Uncharacterized protein n=1 Tax=Actinoplanes siamensis TaxID=1223317 RepID=A0A919NDS0_9ACTN|nr:hypothetical protein Asi03nite_64020 [Actinoplanes siamensis]
MAATLSWINGGVKGPDSPNYQIRTASLSVLQPSADRLPSTRAATIRSAKPLCAITQRHLLAGLLASQPGTTPLG